MSIDEELLSRHRRYEDVEAAISEEFLQPVLGGSPTIAVLARPLREAHSIGWVCCHSFSREQIIVQQIDILVSRALAASGFPVLRFHGRGYGDSRGGMEDVSLSSHVADASDAVELLAEQAGVERIGILGLRLGGTVAALVADRKDLPFMALWEPIVRGAPYMREFLRSQRTFELIQAAQTGMALSGSDLREALDTAGWADVQGFRLTRQAYREISAVDLGKDLRSFRGSSLVVSVSRSGAVKPEHVKLVEHLTKLGGSSRHEGIQHQLAPLLGRRHFVTTSGVMKSDIQVEVARAVADLTVAWASAQVGPDDGMAAR